MPIQRREPVSKFNYDSMSFKTTFEPYTYYPDDYCTYCKGVGTAVRVQVLKDKVRGRV